MYFLRVEAQPLLEPVDLGCQVGSADAEDLGDLGKRSFFEVEQQQGAIERALRVDEPAQNAAALVRVDRIADGRLVQLRVVGNRSLAARRFGTQPGNGDVERDAIKPGRKT